MHYLKIGIDYNAISLYPLSCKCFSQMKVNSNYTIPRPGYLSGMNIYILGNSVFRHYSFSMLAYLEGLPRDISINRTEEKSSCQGSGMYASCSHYSQAAQTMIKFSWNIKLGNNTCDDLRRDVSMPFFVCSYCRNLFIYYIFD